MVENIITENEMERDLTSKTIEFDNTNSNIYISKISL